MWLWVLRDSDSTMRTAKYRPVLSSERTPNRKKQVHGHGLQRTARHQDLLAGWPSVANLTPLHSKKTQRQRQSQLQLKSASTISSLQSVRSSGVRPATIGQIQSLASWSFTEEYALSSGPHWGAASSPSSRPDSNAADQLREHSPERRKHEPTSPAITSSLLDLRELSL
jgi:hypothetical protein